MLIDRCSRGSSRWSDSYGPDVESRCGVFMRAAVFLVYVFPRDIVFTCAFLFYGSYIKEYLTVFRYISNLIYRSSS